LQNKREQHTGLLLGAGVGVCVGIGNVGVVDGLSDTVGERLGGMVQVGLDVGDTVLRRGILQAKMRT